ncbi:MAG: trigger factor [Candidatus Nanopelagicales bacterium]
MTVEKLSDTRVKFTVDLPFDDLTDEIDAAYSRIAGQVQIPGFRKGKVPRQIIDQRLGRGAVLEEVVNAAVPAAYDAAVEDAEVVPLGQPQIEVTDIVDGERIAFVAEVDIRPDFDLPEYKGLAVQVAPLTVTDADVDEQVELLAKRFGSYSEVERAAADGDVLLIDLSATAGGTEIEELAQQAMSYEVGEDGVVPGLDDAVIGLSAGESATFAFTPEFGEYAGTPIDVTVSVGAVRERIMPEIDDDLAMMASEFDTLAELRDDMRARLERGRLMERGQEAREAVNDQLLDSIDIPLPEGIITAEVDQHFEDHGEYDDDHRAEVERDARKALKSQFVLDKIAEAEDVSVGEAELSQWLMMQAPRYGMSPDQFAQALVEAGQVPMAVADVRRGKALAVVLEAAVITDTDGNPIDLSQLNPASDVEALLAEAMAEAEADAEDAEIEAEETVAEAVAEAEVEESEGDRP